MALRSRYLVGLVGILSAGLIAGACSSDDGDGAVTCDAPPMAEAVAFIDATVALGIDFQHQFTTDFCGITDTVGGPGVCAFDYDGDADIDLFFVNRDIGESKLYANQGGSFVDVSGSVGLTAIGDGIGCLAFDKEGDGDLDLYVTTTGADRLFENQGNSFADVTDAAGITVDGYSTSATAGDMDGDGDLDLFIARFVDPDTCPDMCFIVPENCESLPNVLLENNGGQFVDVTAQRGLTSVSPTLVTLFHDFDGDGDLDLYEGNDMGLFHPDRLYINQGGGTFADAAPDYNLDAIGTDTMGVDIGDVDGDGVMDMVTTDFNEKPTRFFNCFTDPLRCNFDALGPETVEYVNWAVALADFNHDGKLDLFQTSGDVASLAGDPNQLFWGGEDGLSFYAATPDEALGALEVTRGAAFADLDGDGDLDIALANVGGVGRVLLNQAAGGHAVTLRFPSTAAGARVTATVNGRSLTEQVLVGGSYLGSSPSHVHFGLGNACEADVLVSWLDGTTTTLTVPAGGIIDVEP